VTLFNDAKDLIDEAENRVTENGLNKNEDKAYNSYAFSKTQAENIAWKISQKQDR